MTLDDFFGDTKKAWDEMQKQKAEEAKQKEEQERQQKIDGLKARREGKKITPPQPPTGAISSIEGEYELMAQTATYALGVQALRESYGRGECPNQPTIVIDGTTIPRALTFKKNIEARVNEYERLKPGDERLRLFNKWNDSCTGMAYKAGSTKFKIIPVCPQLITIDKDSRVEFLPIQYDQVTFPELNSDGSNEKYNALLTKDEVLAHPGWLEALEGDAALLRAYRDIVFTEKPSSTELMQFWVRQNTPRDELRALFVRYLDDGSFANGDYGLNNVGSFLRVVAHRRRAPKI